MEIQKAHNQRKSGALRGTRTPDPLLRRQMLYPAELSAQIQMLDYYICPFGFCQVEKRIFSKIMQGTRRTLHRIFQQSPDQLREEFCNIPLNEYREHDNRQNVRNINANPVRELQSLAGVGLLAEVFPAPAVARSAEHKIHK